MGNGVKCTGREADHSHPFSAETKKVWSCGAISPLLYTSPWRGA